VSLDLEESRAGQGIHARIAARQYEMMGARRNGLREAVARQRVRAMACAKAPLAGVGCGHGCSAHQSLPPPGKQADAFCHPTADLRQYGRQVELLQVRTQRFQNTHDHAATMSTARRFIGPLPFAILRRAAQPQLRRDSLHNMHSCIFDASWTQVSGKLLKSLPGMITSGTYSVRGADVLKLMASTK
jgi:hypothetical protein